MTPLMFAVREGNANIVQLLLAQSKIAVLAIDASKRSVFHFLSFIPSAVTLSIVLDILTMLLEAVGKVGKVANAINQVDRFGYSPLVLASLARFIRPLISYFCSFNIL